MVWANRTLTDTTTFVRAVSPLAGQTAVEDYVADKITHQLEKSVPTQDLATTLLTPEQVASKTPDQLTTALATEIHAGVVQVLGSPSFAALWKSTLEANHAQLVKQLDDNAPQITLDLGPFVTGVMQELKQTKLAPIGDKLDIAPADAKLDFKSSQIEQIHKYYKLLKTVTPVLVLMTLLAIGMCVLISVHHAKTLRRIVVGIGVIALVIAGLIKLPAVITFGGGDPVMLRAVVAIALTLLHDLQVACLAVGVACITSAIGSKIYGMVRARRA